MWNAATDSAYANMSTRHLQQMKAMYDYSRYQLDAANARLLNVVVIISSAVVLLAILFGGRTYILRKRRLRLAEVARYERNIDELKKVQREYEILTENREARISSLLEEKSKEIERLQREKAEYEKKNNTVGQTRFHDAPIIKVLADHARRSHKCMTVAHAAKPMAKPVERQRIPCLPARPRRLLTCRHRHTYATVAVKHIEHTQATLPEDDGNGRLAKRF